MPEAAREFTDAGAEAFVRYYWDVVSYAQDTFDTEVLQTLSNEGCAFCKRGIDGLEAYQERGGASRGGALSARRIQVTRQRAGSLKTADVTLTIANEAQTIDFPGKQDDISIPASSARFKMVLLWTRSRWEVAQIQGQS